MGNIIALDSTLFIQMVNFLITIVVLNFLLIKPIREQIAARSSFTASYTADIEKFNSEASEKIAAYQAALAEARNQASLSREAIKAEGAAKEQELIQSAHADAQKFLSEAKADTARQVKEATKALNAQINGFAAKALAKILG
ncbi:ATP synthase F0 subunit B [Desulfovibrio sp. OttesenSCG-928-A18]|nr:ATP synthase F0 subunit B [Desulfovibrio sp. OttesenSCG-928-A18]